MIVHITNYLGEITFTSTGGTVVVGKGGSESKTSEEKINCSAKGYALLNLRWQWDGQVVATHYENLVWSLLKNV